MMVAEGWAMIEEKTSERDWKEYNE